jgi:hypothetical protein
MQKQNGYPNLIIQTDKFTTESAQGAADALSGTSSISFPRWLFELGRSFSGNPFLRSGTIAAFHTAKQMSATTKTVGENSSHAQKHERWSAGIEPAGWQ